MLAITLLINTCLVWITLRMQLDDALTVSIILLSVQSFVLLNDLWSLRKALLAACREERRLPACVSSAGTAAQQAYDSLLHNITSMRWQVDRLAKFGKKERPLILGQPISPLTCAESVERAAYRRILKTLSEESAADCHAIISGLDSSAPEVVCLEPKGARFAAALKSSLPFPEILGSTLRVIEVRGSLPLFGIRYALISPYCWAASGVRQCGAVWFGYKTYPPNEIEKELARQTAEKIRTEFPAVFELHQLSGKVKEAQNSSAAKSDFLAHMSHDIRSPLHNIRASLHCAAEITENSDVREVVEIALANCNTLEDLVCSILDFSKHQAGRLNASPVNFEIKKEVEASLAQYQIQAKAKGLSLQYVFSDHDPWQVWADRNQIRRVLSNLISNAIKYTAYGSVIVSGRAAGNAVVIEVMDTGSGLSAEEQKRVFDPYVRLQSRMDGVGLGLPICKILCELNKGAIEVRSVKNQGSVFSVTLPMAGSPAEPRPPLVNETLAPA